jgi:predicted RNA-binding protein with PIN domain
LVPGERSVHVAGLREAASRLQRAATTLARSVDGVLAEVPPEPVLIDHGVDAAPLRSPLPLPGGVVADTADGARWLLARPEVVLLVDGYNVAKMAWPDDVLEQQRERLIRALNELVMRTGATAEIVFDGPDDAGPASRQSSRSVGVRYSGGAIADDVVVDLVDAYPADRPVVVVSSDREVRDAARAKAATVVGSDTLIATFSV